ncbi:DUF5050 domain-containing protein [Lachnospira sp.]|jgi:hypothetical protein|uniref:DUF5050 domain-containing protein n=1 Tax=Lachnospira sp. TaxID=2049031 RepID=UPI00257BDED0|nr:DUF5050 domain-containing protein [Lachnospira sp.]
MSKPVKIAIASAVIAIALIGFVTYAILSSRVTYNKDNATGNTTGNLNNGGLFCEYDGKIYFANAADKNTLYVMSSDCTNARKLVDDSVAYINVCGKYIYYVRNNYSPDAIAMVFKGQLYGLYRCNLDGSHIVTITQEKSGMISLCGNYIFYHHYDDQTALTLQKIKIDRKDNTFISETEYNVANVYEQRIYFANETERNRIYYLDTKDDSLHFFYDANAYQVDYEGNYMYYIDLSKDYALMRLNTQTMVLEQIFAPNDAKVINYNVYGTKVFAQVEGDGNTTGLYRLNIDGTQIEYIAQGNITNVHCTSKYTFFMYYADQQTLYRVPTTTTFSKVEIITVK